MSIKQLTAPVTEPVSVAEAKEHLRVLHTHEDGLINSLVVAARVIVENKIKRSLVTQTWQYSCDSFPKWDYIGVELPNPPLQSVDLVTYLDDDGVRQTWDSSEYLVDDFSFLGRLFPAYGECYPDCRKEPNSVIVTYTAGYGNAGDVPQPIKQAILLLVGHLYEHRESVSEMQTLQELPMGVDALLSHYRVVTI